MSIGWTYTYEVRQGFELSEGWLLFQVWPGLVKLFLQAVHETRGFQQIERSNHDDISRRVTSPEHQSLRFLVYAPRVGRFLRFVRVRVDEQIEDGRRVRQLLQ